LDISYGVSRSEDFSRSLAYILNISSDQVNVLARRPGSTVYYFYIDITGSKTNAQSTDVSGDELMVLLFNLYNTASPRISESRLPTILAFNIVAKDPSSDNQGVTLFQQQQSPAEPLVPQLPVIIEQQIVYLENSATSLTHSFADTYLFFLAVILLILFV